MKKILISTLFKNQLVLAKILDTIEPEYIFLWDTEYAKKKQFDIKATITVNLYLKEKNLNSENYNISINKAFAESNYLFNQINEYLDSIINNEKDFKIFIDITGGKGLIASYLTFFSITSDRLIYISYCDFITDSIIYFNLKNKKLIENKKKINLSFAIKNLENRIKINDLTYNQNYKTIYYNDKTEYFRNNSDKMEILLKSFNDTNLRKLFNSYDELLNTWLNKTIIPRLIEINDYKPFFTKVINGKIKTIFQVSEKNKSKISNILINRFNDAFNRDFSPKNIFNKTENELEHIFRIMNKDLQSKIIDLLDYDTNKDKKKLFKIFFNKIKTEIYNEINLQSLKRNDKLITSHVSMEYRKEMISDYCKEKNISDKTIVSFLHSKKLSALFEDIVNYKIYKIIKENKKISAKISSVYSNVILSKNKKNSSLEIDSFILLTSGNVLNYEVKQHYNSVKSKDLDARIKNMKDLIGSETKFRIIFPIYSTDLDLTDPNKESFIEKSSQWINIINDIIKNKKELKIIFFDELEKALSNDLI